MGHATLKKKLISKLRVEFPVYFFNFIFHYVPVILYFYSVPSILYFYSLPSFLYFHPFPSVLCFYSVPTIFFFCSSPSILCFHPVFPILYFHSVRLHFFVCSFNFMFPFCPQNLTADGSHLVTKLGGKKDSSHIGYCQEKTGSNLSETN